MTISRHLLGQSAKVQGSFLLDFFNLISLRVLLLRHVSLSDDKDLLEEEEQRLEMKTVQMETTKRMKQPKHTDLVPVVES